ncbi:MAG TPA: 50S ribosomal protein L21 [Actinomycetota bacterium]|nr:50S ribosomal protein L21 [Actinomycetota bacterium]
MYAVIRTGGKQYKVAAGDVIEVERLKIKGDDPTLTLTPLFVVDDNGNAISGAKELGDYKVGVKVVGDTKGDKLTVFKYRNKSGYRIKTGHRQQYSLIEITSIGGSQDGKAKKAPADTPEAKDSDSVDSNGS